MKVNNTATLQHIGIVGGVGPHAGVDLHVKIISNTVSTYDQDHLPIFHISMSHTIVDRTEYLQGKVQSNPAYAIVEVIKKLHAMDCNIIGIPCNTSHAPVIRTIIDQEVDKLFSNTIRVVHMIEESALFVLDTFSNVKTLGILATMGTYRSLLYESVYKKFNFEILVPETEIKQEKVHSTIYHPEYGIKAQSTPVDQRVVDILVQEANALIARGAEILILGCTELPLAFTSVKDTISVPLIDVTNCLARALIKYSNPQKLMEIPDKILRYKK